MLHIASELVDVSVQAFYQPLLKSYRLWLAFHLHILRVFCMSMKSVRVQSACWSAPLWPVVLKCIVAVQTLWELHCASHLCHLDLSPDNIMLRTDNSNPWDTLRLIDFGFATEFNPGKHLTCMLA